jgi:hypothetical protein
MAQPIEARKPSNNPPEVQSNGCGFQDSNYCEVFARRHRGRINIPRRPSGGHVRGKRGDGKRGGNVGTDGTYPIILPSTSEKAGERPVCPRYSRLHGRMGLASAPPHAAICDRCLCLPCRALHCVRPLFLATLASPRTQLGAGLGEYDHLDARVSTLMCVVAPELGIRRKNAERHSPIRMILIATAR